MVPPEATPSRLSGGGGGENDKADRPQAGSFVSRWRMSRITVVA